MKEIYCKDKSVCIKNVGCAFQYRNFGKFERYFVDFIHYVSDLGGHWTEIRGCEKRDILGKQLGINITEESEDKCTEVKHFGGMDDESTLCYCNSDMCNSSESFHILNTKTWFCGYFLYFLYNLSF